MRPLLLLALFSGLAQAEVILQYFETRWDEIDQRLPEIAEIGYQSMWTPPPGKSPIGGPYPFAYGGNVGYNSFDRFDLGDTPQRGNWETRYGSRTSLRNLADNAHHTDIKIYPDIVFNHTGNGPDYRTYPGMVPQDFHVWLDATQPGGFRRAPRMSVWTPDNGYGGTLNQELVSLMDIVLEFDGRFQGSNSPNYAPDPTPFVRHAGDYDKYPYNPSGTLPAENSRDFMVRWINWLGYAMDYDGVRLDAPKHVYKDFFGMPNQAASLRDKTFLYNIQKNFNERRGLSDADSFDDMYKNDLRRDDAMIFSEFFIGSVGEVDYWRNPADRNWGIQTRYLDFPRKSQMMMDAFNNGNLSALAGFAGFSPEEGVMFAQSHDENPPNKLELAYAYILTRVGTPVVYFSGNNLNQSEIGRQAGKNTWMNKGYDYALGDTVNGFQSNAIPNLVYIHNQFCRSKEYTRWSENDYFAFERYDDLNGNGSPDSSEGLILVALNDSGSDQTRSGVQTSFAPGTKLKDYTGKNPDTVTVGSDGKVSVRVPGSSGQGWVCYAPFNAEAPAAVDPLQFSGSGVNTMPWLIPAGRDGVAKAPRNMVRITGDTVTIDVFYSNANPNQNGETVDNVLVKWGQGQDINGNGSVDFNGKDVVTGGFESTTKITDGHYRITANVANIPEGIHTIKARVFNGRTGKPALFQTFSETVYVDRHGPDLVFENLSAGETVQGARVITVNNPDQTLFNLTYTIDGGASQQADMVIRGKWRISLDGLSSGSHSITLNASEADYGPTRAVINNSGVTRNFTMDTAGQAIAMNHSPNATITEPFFKTVITVPTGQGITPSDIKLYWNGYEQLAPTENPAGSGKFEFTFNGRYVQGGVEKLFTGAFVNGPNFFESVVSKNGTENRVARRVIFNLYGQNMQDSDGDGIPDEIELPGFLNGTNPGPDQQWPGDNSKDLIPNFGETWPRLNAMNADTDYNGSWDGDLDSDGDGVSNLQEVIRGYRLAGDPKRYDIYNASSVPPATIGSLATSSLSVVGGVKLVTITYRPNDGPLKALSPVQVNITPTGGGLGQSFTMLAGTDSFTYSYAVPSGATSISYTFSSGAITDTTGGAGWIASTSAGFEMNGTFDSENFVVSDNGMRIYAAIRGTKLYTATWSTKGGANDHFIFITDKFGDPVNQPWAKAGKIYFDTATKPWIGANPTNAYSNNFGTAGRNWLGDAGKALETEIDLVQVFGSVPKILYFSVAAYPRADGGNLLSQAPASWDSDNNIQVTEFQAVNTTSIRDEDLDGRFDVGTPEFLVSVNGNETDGNYGLRRFYLDELNNEASQVTLKFKPNAAPGAVVTDVEIFTNLNRRDMAVMEEDPSTVTTTSATYFRAYSMSGPDAQGYYSLTLPVNLCGAYRLQARYKVAGVNSGNYIYYTDNGQRRDCAVVVSPKKSLQLNMYEVNPLVIEAKDTTKAGRSTFLDLVNDPALAGESGGFDGRPDALNKDHYSSMGINMLWLQPIHPIGIEGRDTNPETSAPFDPGSPYAVRDYWSVNPVLGRADTAASALSEFQTFVSRLDSWGVGVMMDGTFNHSSPDVIMGQGAVDLNITATAATEIRAFNPGWFAKEGFPSQPAANTGEIAIAPDRNDFGNWTDTREFYFGNYDTLVKSKGIYNTTTKTYPDNANKFEFLLERDEFFGQTNSTRQVWNYFSYYPRYWLEKSGNPVNTPKAESYKGIDGLRCDFAQGLPSQFWEYTINKTRSHKWDFVFMAESLDGFREVAGSKRHGVGYRSARHFDVLNENMVFYWRDTFFGYPANGGAGAVKTPTTGDTFNAFDARRQAFDNVTLLNNLVSHDEVFPHNDTFSIAYAYAQVGALDGIPMLMYGQEAGAQNSAASYAGTAPNSVANFGPIDPTNNFGKYESNFGKNIPNFKVWNQMSNIWNGRTSAEWALQTFYGRVNKARLNAPALQSQNVYFLNKKVQGGGFDNKIFAVGKVKDLGVAAGSPGQSVVFAFVNNNYRTNPTASATFDLNATVSGSTANYFGIERGRSYNVRDLLSDEPAAYVWTAARTGADLIDNGLYVGLPYQPTPTSGSYHAHYLQLADVSAPTISFVPQQFAPFGGTVALNAANSANAEVLYSIVGGDAATAVGVGIACQDGCLAPGGGGGYRPSYASASDVDCAGGGGNGP
ncbi:MAG: alpha-amylase domain-containing protein, partial [Luteolibacter sp.]